MLIIMPYNKFYILFTMLYTLYGTFLYYIYDYIFRYRVRAWPSQIVINAVCNIFTCWYNILCVYYFDCTLMRVRL